MSLVSPKLLPQILASSIGGLLVRLKQREWNIMYHFVKPKYSWEKYTYCDSPQSSTKLYLLHFFQSVLNYYEKNFKVETERFGWFSDFFFELLALEFFEVKEKDQNRKEEEEEKEKQITSTEVDTEEPEVEPNFNLERDLKDCLDSCIDLIFKSLTDSQSRIGNLLRYVPFNSPE